MSGFRLRHPSLLGAAFLLAAAAVIAVIVMKSGGGSERPEYPFPVQTFNDLGRDHLGQGETFDGYNSNPPTSGPHAPRPADWGVSGVPLPKEVPVHNMEHGGVVIWYNCNGGPQPLDDAACRQLSDRLAAITGTAVADGKLVLMTPYSDMDHRIALTAWRTLDAFDEYDAARITAFIASFERKFNPEGF